MRSPMTLDPLGGRTVTVEFGPDAKGLACGAEITLYPESDRPSRVRVYGPNRMAPKLDHPMTGVTVPSPTEINRAIQGWGIYTLDTPITLEPGKQYSISFDPASSPALICTDDQGNQYSSDVHSGLRHSGPQYVDISQYIADHLAEQSMPKPKILSDSSKRQSKAYAKAMRDLADKRSWAEPIRPYTKTLSEEALTKAVEALWRKR